MSTSRKIIIAAVLLLILLLIIAFFVTRSSGTSVTPPVADRSNAPAQTSQTPSEQLEIPLAPVTAAQEVVQKNRNLSSFAMQFVDRFGSYSSEANFQNLNDLASSMTDALRTSAQIEQQSHFASGVFYGVTTKALAIKIENSTSVTATVLISARREETRSGASPRVFNQDIKLELIKLDEQWMVQSADWIPEK